MATDSGGHAEHVGDRFVGRAQGLPAQLGSFSCPDAQISVVTATKPDRRHHLRAAPRWAAPRHFFWTIALAVTVLAQYMVRIKVRVVRYRSIVEVAAWAEVKGTFSLEGYKVLRQGAETVLGERPRLAIAKCREVGRRDVATPSPSRVIVNLVRNLPTPCLAQ